MCHGEDDLRERQRFTDGNPASPSGQKDEYHGAAVTHDPTRVQVSQQRLSRKHPSPTMVSTFNIQHFNQCPEKDGVSSEGNTWRTIDAYPFAIRGIVGDGLPF